MNDKQIANLRADLLQKIRASGADVEEVKQALAELSGDVETCAHMSDIAPDFSELESYTVGELVYNEGALYRFTADHTAGAWTGEDAALTDVDTVIKALAGDIADLQPVDLVTDGNIKPVTSNAVHDAISNIRPRIKQHSIHLASVTSGTSVILGTISDLTDGAVSYYANLFGIVKNNIVGASNYDLDGNIYPTLQGDIKYLPKVTQSEVYVVFSILY